MARREGEQEKKNIFDQFIDLAATVRAYLRQEARRTVKDTLISPVDKLKNRVILGIIGAFTIGFGSIFLSISSFLILANLLNSYWGAFGLVGLILVITGAIMLGIMAKIK